MVEDNNFEKKLIAAYDRMMERVNHFLADAEQQAMPALKRNIDKAHQQAIELKELTSEEADIVAAYLRRDLEDVGHYLQNTGEDLSTWLKFDIQLVEERMLDLFAQVADKSRQGLAQLAQQAKRAEEYHTGEITGIGALTCHNCGTEVHFKKTSRIPPCPKCQNTVFARAQQD